MNFEKVEVKMKMKSYFISRSLEEYLNTNFSEEKILYRRRVVSFVVSYSDIYEKGAKILLYSFFF